MGRRISFFVVTVALAAVLLAACSGGDDRSVGIGQVDDTTTTTELTTTTAGPTTTAATVPPVGQPACTDDALVAAYQNAKGSTPAGRSFSTLRCLGGWALGSFHSAKDAPIFELFHAESGFWVFKNEGYADVCKDQGVPPNVAPQIGCVA